MTSTGHSSANPVVDANEGTIGGRTVGKERNRDDSMTKSSTIHRTTGAPRHLLERSPKDGFSPIRDLAATLGVRVASYEAPKSDGSRFGSPRVIDRERREELGYGALPNDLLVRVEDRVGFLIPEQSPVDLGYKVAGQVAQIVMERPGIFPSDVLQHLGQRVMEGTLKLPDQLSQDTVIALGGVIDLTHELTIQYIEATDQAGGAEAIK